MPERPIWERSFDRKGFVAISAMTAFLAACGGDDESSSGTTTGGSAAKPSGTLLYYNWADYVNPKTYPAFTKATSVKVEKDFYVSNEDLQAKLEGRGHGLRPGRPDRLADGEDPGRRRAPAKARPDEAADSRRRTSTPSSRACRSTRTTSGRSPKDWGTTGFVYRPIW